MFDWNRLQTWTRLWWREEEDAAPAAVVAAVVARGRASAFANRVEEGEGWSYPRILSSSSTWKCTSSRPGSAWRKWLAKPARCGAPCRRVRKGNTFSWRKRRGEEEDRDKRKVCLLVIPKLVIRTRGWNGSRERSFDSKAFSRTRSCEESDACSKTSGAFQSKCSRIFARRRNNNNNTNSYLSLKSKHKEIRIHCSTLLSRVLCVSTRKKKKNAFCTVWDKYTLVFIYRYVILPSYCGKEKEGRANNAGKV